MPGADRDLPQQPLSWLIGPVRALIAPLRTARSARMPSAIPSRRLAGAVATPARTARAAGLSIDRVGLAALPTGAPVWPVELQSVRPIG
jgi:hypothetical protein